MDIHQIQKDRLAMIQETSEFIKKRIPTAKLPKLAIICGSGLQNLADTLTDTIILDYKEIPNFAKNTVAGHAGKLVFGNIASVPTVCMVGRFHFYEGHSMFQCTFPVRVFRALQTVKTLIVTNASGGLNPTFSVGDVMIIRDHINMPGLAGNHPLVGVNLDSFGPRFPAMTDAYDKDLGHLVALAARRCNMDEKIIREGTYVMVSGPSYETKSEATMLRRMGADAVGMSTVPEVIVARHSGLRVLGLALITNSVITVENESLGIAPPSHEEVLLTSSKRSKDMQNLVVTLVDLMESQI